MVKGIPEVSRWHVAGMMVVIAMLLGALVHQSVQRVKPSPTAQEVKSSPTAAKVENEEVTQARFDSALSQAVQDPNSNASDNRQLIDKIRNTPNSNSAAKVFLAAPFIYYANGQKGTVIFRSDGTGTIRKARARGLCSCNDSQDNCEIGPIAVEGFHWYKWRAPRQGNDHFYLCFIYDANNRVWCRPGISGITRTAPEQYYVLDFGGGFRWYTAVPVAYTDE